jgi:hypothetical protein
MMSSSPVSSSSLSISERRRDEKRRETHKEHVTDSDTRYTEPRSEDMSNRVKNMLEKPQHNNLMWKTGWQMKRDKKHIKNMLQTWIHNICNRDLN